MKNGEQFLTTKPHRFMLPNRLVGLFLPNHNCDLMAAQLWIRTGSIHEDQRMGSGISHFVEHMVFKGTKKRTGIDIFAEAQRLGASLNAYTSFDRTVYTFDGPQEALRSGLDLISDVVFGATFPLDEFHKERDVILREIDMYDDDPDDQLSQRVLETTFKLHPYRFPVIGIRSIFEELTHEDLCHYWKWRYVPNNSTLVIVGPFELEEVRMMCEEFFGTLEAKSLKPITFPSEPFQLADREERFYGNYNLVRGVITFKIPGVGHKDAVGLNILANVLGSGYSSLLYQKLREELNLVHDVDASCWTGEDHGLFWIQYVCDVGKRADVEKFIGGELKNLSVAGISATTLEKALNQAISSEIDAHNTVHGQAHHLGWAEVTIGDFNYPRFYLEQLRILKPKDVKSIVQKYFKLPTLTCVSLEPLCAQVRPKATIRPTMRPIDVAIRQLPNNVRLIYQKCQHFPKTHIKAMFLGSSHYEDSRKRGISRLLSILLTKDTETHSSRSIAEIMEGLGGHLAPFVNNNSFGLNLEILSSKLKTSVDVLEEALTGPVFIRDVFNREKISQIAAIKDAMDNALTRAFNTLRATFFEPYPYCIDPMGTEMTVEDIRHEDIFEAYRRLIVGANLVFSVTSTHRLNTIVDLLTPIAEKMPSTPFIPIVLNDSFRRGERAALRKNIVFDKEQSLILKAYPLCGCTHDDFYATEFIAELLSGLSSQFVIQVREKLGLAYTLGANRLLGLETGMFYLFAGTNSASLALIESEMQRAISDIRDGRIALEDFESSYIRLKVRRRTRMQAIGKRASAVGFRLLYDYPDKSYDVYEKCLAQVSLDDVVTVANKYLSDDRSCTILASANQSLP